MSGKHKQLKIVIFLLLPIFLSLFTFAAPQRASAFIDNDALPITEQQDRTISYSILHCLKDKDLEQQVSASSLNSFMIYQRDYDEVAVGHELVADDGTAKCSSLGYERGLRFVGMTPLEFKDALYERKGDKYQLKGGDPVATLSAQLERRQAEKRQSNAEATGPKEKARRVLVGLSRCITTIPAGDKAENDTVKVGTTMYQYRNGKSAGDQISMGYDLQEDGQFKCETLINLSQPNQLNAIAQIPQGITLDNINDQPGVLAAVAGGASAEDALANTDPNGNGGDTCESAGALGWLMCPIINALDGFLNWVDSQIQRLMIVDENKYRDESLKETWASVRNIAYMLLVPVMLVMVIGTALGFQFVDAYTVKKALPRLVIATLFIGLSWEIAGFLIQLSNDVGRGVLGLITAPLDIRAGADGLTLQDLYKTNAGGLGTQAVIIGVAGAAISAPGALSVVTSFLGTAALILLTAFLVLITRQLFILAIMIFLPVAILAWIFPGNDKLWKLIWGTFTKLLIMFPLIAALIGVGRVFAYVIGNADSSGAEGGLLNPLLKLTAYVLPYALIPFTFRAAGGAFGNLVGMVNDRQKGLFDRLKKGRQPKYERVGRNVVQKRADLQNRWQEQASQGNWLRRTAYSQLSRKAGGYNIQAADSARRAHVSKELNDQIATGRDDEIRALTVNKAWAATKGALVDDGEGNMSNGFTRITNGGKGKRQYMSLGGAWYDEATVDEGRRRWGRDTYAQQAALSYEMRKASTNEELQNIATNYHNIAQGKDGWSMTENEAGGAWIGAAFENQNQHLEYKHTRWQDGVIDASRARKFATEVYEKKGSYPLAQMSANTIAQLKKAYDVGDADTKRMVQGAAETFMTRYGGGGAGDPNDPAIIAALQQQQQNPQQIGQGQSVVQTNTPGAAHVAEAVRQLAVDVGVYHPLPPANDVGPMAPTPPIDRQN